MRAIPLILTEPALSRAFNVSGRARWFVAVDERTTLWAAALGALAVVFVGVFLARALNIWVDEAFTLRTTGDGPLEAWTRAITFEVQPPLYFVIEAAWRSANETSLSFARLPSVFFAAATVAVIVISTHRIAPGVPPALVALLSVLNPVFLWAAAEMRVYALVLLIGAVLTWSFFEAFLVTPNSHRARIWYVVFAIAGLYTQYYVGFVLLAQCFVLIALRRSALRAYIGSMAVVAVGFAPFVRVAMMHVEASGSFVSRATFLHAAHEVGNVAFAFVLPHDINWSGAAKIAGFILAGALLAGLFAFGRPVLRDSLARGATLQWLFCLAVFILLFGLSGVPVDPLRHLTIAAPSSLIVGYVLLSSLTRRRALAITAAAAIFVLFASLALWTNYRPPLAKKGDWQRVAEMLSTIDRSTRIAVFPAESALPLGFYLHRATIPIPRPMPFTNDYVGATTLRAQSDVANVLDPVPAGSARLWLVTTDECLKRKLTAYDYNCPLLEAYLKRRYRLVRGVEFRGSVARLFVRIFAVSSNPAGSENAN